MMKSMLIYSIKLSLVLLFCASCIQRPNDPYVSQMSYPNEWVVAAVETAAGNGKAVTLLAEPGSGRLHPTDEIEVGENPRAVTFLRYQGRNFVYVANHDSGTVSVLNLDSKTGALELVQTVTGLTNAAAILAVTRPEVWVGYAGGIQRFSVETEFGRLTAIGGPYNPGGAVSDLTATTFGSGVYGVYATVTGDRVAASLFDGTSGFSAAGTQVFDTVEDIEATSLLVSGSYVPHLAIVDSGLDTLYLYSIDTDTAAISSADSIATVNPVAVELHSFTNSAVVMDTSGVLRTYQLDDTSNFSLTMTNTDHSSTAFSFLGYHATYVYSLGTEGITTWLPGNFSLGTQMILLRETSLADYGLYANALTVVRIQ